MTAPAPAGPRSRGKARVKRVSFWALFCVVVLAALAAITARRRREDPQSPAFIAESACQLLREKIDAPVDAIPQVSRTDPATAQGTGASAAPQPVPPRPRRNLFAPGRWEDPQAASPGPSRSAPRLSLPKLSGIFIDGSRRQAALGGKLTRTGDTVDGWRVVEIGPDTVVLEQGGSRQTVGLGRRP